MLLARIATALVLGGLVVCAVLWLPAGVLAAGLVLFALAGAWEWARLAGFNGVASRVAYAGSVTAIAACAAFQPAADAVRLHLLVAGACWWLAALAFVVWFQRHGNPRIGSRVLLGAIGLLLFVPALTALAMLYAAAPANILVLFALVWAADIFAYAGGRAYGSHKLVSRVSPGKTWEGAAAGLAGTLLVAWVAGALWPEVPRGGWPLLVVAVFLASVVGDLTESLAKRFRGVKDSGAMLPGHGGAMDRIDSVVAAAPVFALLMGTAEQA